MLRIGKNPKDSVENELSAEKQEAPYTTPKPFSPYQGTTSEIKYSRITRRPPPGQ